MIEIASKGPLESPCGIKPVRTVASRHCFSEGAEGQSRKALPQMAARRWPASILFNDNASLDNLSLLRDSSYLSLYFACRWDIRHFDCCRFVLARTHHDDGSRGRGNCAASYRRFFTSGPKLYRCRSVVQKIWNPIEDRLMLTCLSACTFFLAT